jgi:hypothetical protein
VTLARYLDQVTEKILAALVAVLLLVAVACAVLLRICMRARNPRAMEGHSDLHVPCGKKEAGMQKKKLFLHRILVMIPRVLWVQLSFTALACSCSSLWQASNGYMPS